MTTAEALDWYYAARSHFEEVDGGDLMDLTRQSRLARADHGVHLTAELMARAIARAIARETRQPVWIGMFR